MKWEQDARGRYYIEGYSGLFANAPYIYTAEYGYTVEGRKTHPKGFKGHGKASLTRAKKFAEKEFRTKYVLANPGIEKGKWIPAHAVKFNKDGGVSILY